MGECRAKSFKGGGLDFAQDRKFNFFLSPGGEV